MQQTIYDTKRNGLYRDRVQNLLVDRFRRSQSMMQSHYHPYFELFYVVEGNCRMFVDHNLFFASQGDLIIIPPSTLHRTQYEAEVDRITMSFTQSYADLLKTVAGDQFFSSNIQAGKLTFRAEKRIKAEEIFEELLSEEKKQDKYSEINRKSLCLKLFVLIARNAENINQIESLTNETEASIQKAAGFIFENYDKDISLQMAAEIAGMRDTYFSRKFQEVTGFGFKEYLTNIRIQHSQEMLRNGTLTITQIATACGFSNSNYFGDAFKKQTGISPRDFRKQQT